MRTVGGVLALCLVLVVVKAVVVALAIALGLALVVSLIRRPADTLAFLGALGLLGLAQARPVACIVTIGVVALAVVVAGAWRRSKLLRLTDDSSAETESRSDGCR